MPTERLLQHLAYQSAADTHTTLMTPFGAAMLATMTPATAVITPIVVTTVIPPASIVPAIAAAIVAAITHIAAIIMPAAIVTHVAAAMIRALLVRSVVHLRRCGT